MAFVRSRTPLRRMTVYVSKYSHVVATVHTTRGPLSAGWATEGRVKSARVAARTRPPSPAGSDRRTDQSGPDSSRQRLRSFWQARGPPAGMAESPAAFSSRSATDFPSLPG